MQYELSLFLALYLKVGKSNLSTKDFQRMLKNSAKTALPASMHAENESLCTRGPGPRDLNPIPFGEAYEEL
jgi:hypothetical protein